MKATTVSTRLLLLAPLGLLWACSESTPTPDGPSGGTSSGTAGSVSTGGTVSGGASGSSAGGAAGSATGGTSGSATGGTAGAMGGTAGTLAGAGGNATGGAAGSATGGTAGTTGGSAGSSAGGAAGNSAGGTAGAMGGAAGNAMGGSAGSGAGTAGSAGMSGSGSGGYPIGNPAVPSAGCDEASGSLGNGTHEITSAGLDREYIVSLPDNYDPTKPYRLVFGMHWLGGSADAVNNDGWFRLKALDTEDSTIWVAPQGYTDDWPWRGNDDLDHTFFEELVALLQSELCIDVSRIFSVGFSFGAMYTNALAQTHQDTLRGVVVYATADYNIFFPDNTGEPLAYMGVHGSTDGTCPITSGRDSKDRFVENNGCMKPGSVPEATSSTHVTYDYECDPNYPVRWSTFQGGHTDQPTDPGQSRSWVMEESWEFISQF